MQSPNPKPQATNATLAQLRQRYAHAVRMHAAHPCGNTARAVARTGAALLKRGAL